MKYENELKKRVRAAGFQLPWEVAISAILLVFLLLYAVYPNKARAQHHHQFHQDFYKNWKEPGKDSSCCNARLMLEDLEGGAYEIGDCEPTEAKIIKGDWHVWVRQLKEWLRVPDEKIVRYPNPNIFDAHICWTPARGIICFRPPDTGG